MNQAIDLVQILIGALAFIIALTVHEFSHALIARFQGDMTAEHKGRLTLNPIAHIDLFGTILLPGSLILLGSPFVIGWAKPVPFNPLALKYKQWGSFLVGIAGPISNFLMALMVVILMRLLIPLRLENSLLPDFLSQLAWINIVLGVFNLIPIPPLDGSKLLTRFLSWQQYAHFEMYGPYILLALLLIERFIPFIGLTSGYVLYGMMWLVNSALPV